MRKVDAPKPPEMAYPRREVSRELVVGEVQLLEVGPQREINGEGGEAVELQAEDSELGEPAKRLEIAGEAQVLKDDPDDPLSRRVAVDTDPRSVAGAGRVVPAVEQAIQGCGRAG